MRARLPLAALGLGLLGILPFIGLGIAALSTSDPTQSTRLLLALVAYGAVVLAFLGGVHWGFVLHPVLPEGLAPDARRDATRLGLGVLPSLIGWLALLIPLLGLPEVGLAVLILGFLATILTEHALRRRGLVPPAYVAMRWALSIVVLVVLISVLALRLIGARLIF
jgi:uncharacterized membrane protein YidH (DUF202 family)